MNKAKGLYAGTEVEEKWWRPYLRDGFFMQGLSEYWLSDEAFCFRRYLTRTPLCIPWRSVVEIKTGTWHAGQWFLGYPVIKLVWRKDGRRLSSGFVVGDKNTARNLMARLRRQPAR
jgi:hypothetical protein